MDGISDAAEPGPDVRRPPAALAAACASSNSSRSRFITSAGSSLARVPCAAAIGTRGTSLVFAPALHPPGARGRRSRLFLLFGSLCSGEREGAGSPEGARAGRNPSDRICSAKIGRNSKENITPVARRAAGVARRIKEIFLISRKRPPPAPRPARGP
ncbi:hypothetical protein EVAR_78399_1 [Eumeta japonica]|uniref:Uncharacterized protein n=1 Tax=Eumeta variegata TaxID=151549 RepID=A0A4C1T6K1_EUMVA|nr:hypothetical protein EVAR_78399_1 [Eumeta japonica]